MPHRLRSLYQPLNDPIFTQNLMDALDEHEAQSSEAAASSPPPMNFTEEDISTQTLFLEEFSEGDEVDEEFNPGRNDTRRRAIRRSDDEKAIAVLQYMSNISHFSLRKFFEVLFTSENPQIKHASGIFFRDGSGGTEVMDLWWEMATHLQRGDNQPMSTWTITHAAELCKKEFSFLTDRASSGPHADDAYTLRVNADTVTMDFVQSFDLGSLTACYDRTLPLFQHILGECIGSKSIRGRNPDHARTTATSILLNMRSRRTNYQAAAHAVILWDQRVPKRLVQGLNHIGFSTSYYFQITAIQSLSRDCVRRARIAAADPTKLKMLPYDNFN
ncbi:hypothetical protein ABKN59_010552 [Abortiporus biennis]